jgi:hypothetical protein
MDERTMAESFEETDSVGFAHTLLKNAMFKLAN